MVPALNLFLEEALELDRQDELSSFKKQFIFPKGKDGKEKIYLCGNSLGLQPKLARSYVNQELDDWEKWGVDGHTHAVNPWMPYHELLTLPMAHVVGALPKEVVVMNTLTVNLHLMMVSFYRPTKDRFKIMIERGAFPSDRYAVWSQLQYHGFDPSIGLIELTPREGEDCLRLEDVLSSIDQHGNELALILIGNVNYYTGQSFDMKSITRAGHSVGAKVAFDLAHGAGNIVCDLHENGPDFAAWCSYKYLNSGPGALSGCFVHERHLSDPEIPRFTGWWGHNKANRFKMGPDFEPIQTAEAWQLSNPPILPMACMRASLELFHEAGIHRLRQKSVAVTSFMLKALEALDTDLFKVITPLDAESRGAQLSIKVLNADKSLFNFISSNQVVADWREPDVVRIAFAPLYNSFEDAAKFVHILQQYILNQAAH